MGSCCRSGSGSFPPIAATTSRAVTAKLPIRNELRLKWERRDAKQEQHRIKQSKPCEAERNDAENGKPEEKEVEAAEYSSNRA